MLTIRRWAVLTIGIFFFGVVAICGCDNRQSKREMRVKDVDAQLDLSSRELRLTNRGENLENADLVISFLDHSGGQQQQKLFSVPQWRTTQTIVIEGFEPFKADVYEDSSSVLARIHGTAKTSDENKEVLIDWRLEFYWKTNDRPRGPVHGNEAAPGIIR